MSKIIRRKHDETPPSAESQTTASPVARLDYPIADKLKKILPESSMLENMACPTGLDESHINWGILVVDDEEDVHRITRLVLKGFVYQGKQLEILSAYSAEQAKEMLTEHPDVALIFLDVVMETHDAGLQLVRHIRETLRNRFVCIILRTGQAGFAPEEEVVVKYEINDYAEKTELSRQKLISLTATGLRGYADMIAIELCRQYLEEKVTERTGDLLRHNEKLRHLNQELTRLNQERNEFLGIAAHDLKNPLQAIQGSAELIETAYDSFSRDQIIDFAKMIGESSQRMFELISNLLEVNRIELGDYKVVLTQVDVFPILNKLVKDYALRAQLKNIQIDFEIPITPCIAYTDSQMLYQILDNLLSNAVKYTFHGKNIVVRLLANSDAIRCEIQDEGLGLNVEEQKKLFNKFTKLSTRPTGGEHSTGLGLFIVKKLIDAVRGKVWCASEQGQGSTFCVEFPVEPSSSH
jgi:two-component system, sensor histidine kinase and response regulator